MTSVRSDVGNLLQLRARPPPPPQKPRPAFQDRRGREKAKVRTKDRKASKAHSLANAKRQAMALHRRSRLPILCNSTATKLSASHLTKDTAAMHSANTFTHVRSNSLAENHAEKAIQRASIATHRRHPRPDSRSWMVTGLSSCICRRARQLILQTTRHRARHALQSTVSTIPLNSQPPHRP